MPYLPKGFAPETPPRSIGRSTRRTSSAGQWDYQLFYQENFPAAHAAFEADAQHGEACSQGAIRPRVAVARTALIRQDGAGLVAPAVPRCADGCQVLTEADLAAYAALERNGFFGPDSGTEP